ncbi:hypothetical protein [Lepagella muris]|uniref:Uncharacterized protein n=1 Tax=Lepagella muris TaxID=3032870 RepID=A0AC61RIE7_9BACT|nr:hypothetical protein [Lepagella muris]TGY80954.1 hypothetical protein E5331_00815 [Lepagella muris]THG54032.1 hypothetical protein E5984_00815 [Bacteroidales bacterium]TKC56713.1 hypothetical protein E5359_013210 [Bacteroidales bacterium]
MTTTNEYGTATGYFVPNDNFIKRGEYKRTTLDDEKAKADILVTAIDSHYEIRVQKSSIKLSGRGVKRSKWIGNIYYVTERVYKQLCKEYNVMCDF